MARNTSCDQDNYCHLLLLPVCLGVVNQIIYIYIYIYGSTLNYETVSHFVITMESYIKAAVKIMLAITIATVCPASVMVNAHSGMFVMYNYYTCNNETEITGKFT